MRWYGISLILLLFIMGCAPKTVYVMVEPPNVESPAVLDAKYTKAMRRDPCYVATELTGAFTIDTDAIDNRMNEAEYFANRFACMWERENFGEMYKMFSSKLRKERTPKSFANIMTLLKVKNKQPSAVWVEKIEFYENATVAHVYYSSEYKMTTADIEGTVEPRIVIQVEDNKWVCGDMTEIFFKYCADHSDCKVDKACKDRCDGQGLEAKARCVSIVDECYCDCTGAERPELKFYDYT